MCVHCYFADHFSELKNRIFSKSKGRILAELQLSFNKSDYYLVTSDL